MKGHEINLSVKGNNKWGPKPSVAIQYISLSAVYMIELKLSVLLFGHTEAT